MFYYIYGWEKKIYIATFEIFLGKEKNEIGCVN